MIHILITDELQQSGLDRLAAAENVQFDIKTGLSKEELVDKIKFDQINEEKLGPFQNGKKDSFVRIAIENSDAVIRGSEELNEELNSFLDDLDIPVLDYQPLEGFTEAYSDFYLNKVL